MLPTKNLSYLVTSLSQAYLFRRHWRLMALSCRKRGGRQWCLTELNGLSSYFCYKKFQYLTTHLKSFTVFYLLLSFSCSFSDYSFCTSSTLPRIRLFSFTAASFAAMSTFLFSTIVRLPPKHQITPETNLLAYKKSFPQDISTYSNT